MIRVECASDAEHEVSLVSARECFQIASFYNGFEFASLITGESYNVISLRSFVVFRVRAACRRGNRLGHDVHHH